MNPLTRYETYYVQRDYTLLDVFDKLKTQFAIKKVVYPGCYVHISPSLIFPEVLYIDTDRQAQKFFTAPDLSMYIEQHKTYSESPTVHFFSQSYTQFIKAFAQQFDLLISLYAGFISEPCKRYLKSGGYLLCNNSHGDAGLAALDPDFTLRATLNKSRGTYRINTQNLDSYFRPKKNLTLTPDYLKSLKRGLGYTKSASLYLFQHI